MAEIVKQQFSNLVTEQDMCKLIGDKFEESEKDVSERQNRERNIIIFKLPEPNTNLTTERKTKDLENINKMIDFMYTENEQDVIVEKIIRLGARHKEYQQNSRPVLVTFINFQAKKSFLRNSKLLKDSNDKVHKQVAIANDMTKRDREKELELVNQRREKKLGSGGPLEICDPESTMGQKNCKNKKTIKNIPMLKCFYTNCDTLTNKMDELLFYINTNNPDILVLTEVAPKNNRYLLQKSDLEIKGYSLYINNFEEKGVRGVAIYVKKI